jgi:hypothetical protein
VVRRGAFGADWGQQLLRIGRGDGDRSFRLPVGRGALNRRWRAGRSAGHAVSRPDRQPKQGLVRARRCRPARHGERRSRAMTITI